MSDVCEVKAEFDLTVVQNDSVESLKQLLTVSLAELVLSVYHARPSEIADYLAKARSENPKISLSEGFVGYHLMNGWSDSSVSALPKNETSSEIIFRNEDQDFLLATSLAEESLFAEKPSGIVWHRKTLDGELRYVCGVLKKCIVHFDGSIALCKSTISDIVDIDKAELVATKYGSLFEQWKLCLQQKYKREANVNAWIKHEKIGLPPILFLSIDKTYETDPTKPE